VIERFGGGSIHEHLDAPAGVEDCIRELRTGHDHQADRRPAASGEAMREPLRPVSRASGDCSSKTSTCPAAGVTASKHDQTPTRASTAEAGASQSAFITVGIRLRSYRRSASELRPILTVGNVDEPRSILRAGRVP
jgi:hypothetical protein